MHIIDWSPTARRLTFRRYNTFRSLSARLERAPQAAHNKWLPRLKSRLATDANAVVTAERSLQRNTAELTQRKARLAELRAGAEVYLRVLVTPDAEFPGGPEDVSEILAARLARAPHGRHLAKELRRAIAEYVSAAKRVSVQRDRATRALGRFLASVAHGCGVVTAAHMQGRVIESVKRAQQPRRHRRVARSPNVTLVTRAGGGPSAPAPTAPRASA